MSTIPMVVFDQASIQAPFVSPPTGFPLFSGAWSSSTQYGTYSTVTFSGSVYASLQPNINVTPGTNGAVWALAIPAGGGVSSVAATVPSALLAVSGSPITSTGTLALSLVNQSANQIFSGPTTGAATAPTFRALVAADIPSLPASQITTGLLALARGGTNADLSATGGTSRVLKQVSTGAAITVGQLAAADLSDTATAGKVLRGNGSSFVSATLAFSDLSGSVAAAQLPNPSASTLGGVESIAAVTSKWVNAISTSGVPSATQPASTDLSDVATLATLTGTQTLNNKTIGSTFQGLSVVDTVTSPLVFSVHSLLNTATNSGSFTASAAAGTYELSGYCYVSTAGTSGTVGLSFAFNNGAAKAINSAGNANLGTLGSDCTIPTQVIQVAAGTSLSWGASVTSGVGAFKYDVHLILRRIK